MRHNRGFTLIELVIVMVIISAGLLGLVSLLSNASTSLTTNEILQQATQYAQECAERVIATRRDLGFTSANINNTMCDSPAIATGFSRTVNVGNPYSGTGTGTAPCPSGTSNCKNVTVTVTNSALSSSITVMLVNY